jgi:hypothetical protein
VPIAGTPPAAYCTPIRISDRPIITTTSPVTIGGKAKRMRPTKKLRAVWNSPPMIAAVVSSAIAATPRPATIGIITGRNAKLVPCTSGSRAPAGPSPIVWSNVATPANTIDIWIM